MWKDIVMTALPWLLRGGGVSGVAGITAVIFPAQPIANVYAAISPQQEINGQPQKNLRLSFQCAGIGPQGASVPCYQRFLYIYVPAKEAEIIEALQLPGPSPKKNISLAKAQISRKDGLAILHLPRALRTGESISVNYTLDQLITANDIQFSDGNRILSIPHSNRDAVKDIDGNVLEGRYNINYWEEPSMGDRLAHAFAVALDYLDDS